MFQTDIRAMEEAAMEMQRHIRKWNKAISDAEAAAGGLRSLSGMEEAAEKIRSQIVRMEEKRRQMSTMMLGLKKMAECYGICDKNILNYAEGIQGSNGKGFEWYQIKIPEAVTNKLKQIIY